MPKINFDNLSGGYDSQKGPSSKDVFVPGKDMVIGDSRQFRIENKDVMGHGMDATSGNGDALTHWCKDFFNFGLRFEFRQGSKDKVNGFVIRTNNEMEVLCKADDTEVFKKAPKSTEYAEQNEIVLKNDPREGSRAIVKVKTSDGKIRSYQFDGSAQVWDYPQNTNVDPVFNWHEMREIVIVDDFTDVKKGLPLTSSFVGGFEPLDLSDLGIKSTEPKSDIPSGWKKIS